MSFALCVCNHEENILITRMQSADTQRENKVIALHSKYYYWLLEDSAPFILLLQNSYEGKFIGRQFTIIKNQFLNKTFSLINIMQGILMSYICFRYY